MKTNKNALAWLLTVVAFCGFCALIACNTANAQVEPLTGQHQYTFERMDYLLFLPAEYNEKPDIEWPLILYLHGAGAKNMAELRTYGMAEKVDTDKNLPFIVLSPLFLGSDATHLLNMCYDLTADRPLDTNHIDPILEKTMTLIDEIASTYGIDTSRIYATGVSQGGFMTWTLAAAYPERFAAIAPVAGTGRTRIRMSPEGGTCLGFHRRNRQSSNS